MSPTAADLQWMQKALALARRGEGLTRPKPPVGAVLVKNGKLIGQGWHRRAGGPHAEIYAMRQAGKNAREATLYVTLEPCSTQGRTPPCVAAILAAGIQRVVVGAIDPNPKHAGRGLRLLRRHGIETVRCPSDAATSLIAPFACHLCHHRPLFTLKLGLTLDGRIADHHHSSRWITGPKARALVQDMRRTADAIMVGAGTVRHDDPSLWPRPPKGRNPWRVIVASQGPLPADARVFTDAHAPRTIVAAPRGWQPARAAQLREQGVTVWELPKKDFLSAMARKLGQLDILRVFCEGGGILASGLLENRFVDELNIFLSPLMLGGPVGAVGSARWPLPQAPRLAIRSTTPVGGDLLLRLTPLSGQEDSCSPA